MATATFLVGLFIVLIAIKSAIKEVRPIPEMLNFKAVMVLGFLAIGSMVMFVGLIAFKVSR